MVVRTGRTFSEGVGDQTVTSLEANVGLEGLIGNRANHLQGDVRAVEQTSIISTGTLVASNIVVSVADVSRIRIDVDLQLAIDCTSEQVAGIINVQVSVESRGVIQNTSHGEGGSHISRADDHVTLASTSELGNSVTISLDLEQQTFELFNRPSTVGIEIQVEGTSCVYVVLSTGKGSSVNSSNDLSVDLRKDLRGEDVSQLSFSIETVDSTEILSQFHGVLSLEGTATGFNNGLLDRETHLTKLVTGLAEALHLSLVHTTHLLQGRIVGGTTRVGSVGGYTTSTQGRIQQAGVTGGRSFTRYVGVVDILSRCIRTIGVQTGGRAFRLSAVVIEGAIPTVAGQALGATLVIYNRTVGAIIGGASSVNRDELTVSIQFVAVVLSTVLEGVSTVREGRIGFVEECFVGAVGTVVLSTHGEDHAGRTGHGLNAADVVSNQVRHRASDQADQNGIETGTGAEVGVQVTINTTTNGTAGEALITRSVNAHGGGFGQETAAHSHGGLFLEERFLVLQELGGDSLSIWIFDLRKILMTQNRLPLFCKMIRHL